jgi:hypothetical protein
MTLTTSFSTARRAISDLAQNQSLDEERREVFESVLAALANDLPDADRWAAGGYLLCHLSHTAVPQPRAGLRLV